MPKIKGYYARHITWTKFACFCLCLSQKTGVVSEVTEPHSDGALCMKLAWPGMARTVYGDHQRFLDTYYRPYPGIEICVIKAKVLLSRTRCRRNTI